MYENNKSENYLSHAKVYIYNVTMNSNVQLNKFIDKDSPIKQDIAKSYNQM